MSLPRFWTLTRIGLSCVSTCPVFFRPAFFCHRLPPPLRTSMSDYVTRYVCLSCARNQPAGTSAYYTNFRTASVHVSRSKYCSAQNLGIGTVSIGHRSTDQEAGGSGAAGPWPPHPVQAAQDKPAEHLSSGKTSYGTSLVRYMHVGI